MDKQTRQALADMRDAVSIMRFAVLHAVDAIDEVKISAGCASATRYASRAREACAEVHEILNRITLPDPSPTGE
jgi:hypothetical protein